MFSRTTSRLRDRGNVLRASITSCIEALEGRQLLSAAPNPGGAPNAPFALLASPRAAQGISFAFYDSATNETGFVVERATSPNGPFAALTTLAASPGSGQRVIYTDFSTSPGFTYYYTATAINGTYQSSTPAAVSGQASGAPTTVPNGPYGLTATATLANAVNLSFYNSADNEMGFYISRYDDPGLNNGSKFFELDQVAAVGQQLTFTDTTAQPGHTYYYFVSAFNSAYGSSTAGPASVTTPSASGALAPVTTFGTAGSVTDANVAGASHLTVLTANGAVYTLSPSLRFIPPSQSGPIVDRFTAGGVLDTSFGPDQSGRLFVNLQISSKFSTVTSIAAQVDGKLIVVGTTPVGNDSAILVARYNIDGSLDTTFNDGSGQFLVDYAGAEQPSDVAIGTDGKIYIGGVHQVYQSSSFEFFAIRLNADGSLDRSFGFNGISKGDAHADLRALSIAVDPIDGSVVVAGNSSDVAGPYGTHVIEVARLLPSGVASGTFSSAAVPNTVTYSSAEDVLVQADHKIVVVGTNNNEAFAQRLNADATLDPTWAGPGNVILGAAPQTSTANAVTQLSDGSYIVVGSSSDPLNTDGLIAHLHADGTLDQTAGGNGGIILNDRPGSSGRSNTVFSDVALAPDGAIYATGEDNSVLLLSKYRFS